MTAFSLKFYRCVAMMIGAIVGVGVFGLPYIFAKVGFGLALVELLIMGFFMTILMLMQAEISIQTKGQQRLVGSVRVYLGNGWSWLVTIALAGGIWGAMLAYLIVGGKFLFLIGSPLFGGTEFVYALVMGVFASLLIYRGLKFASKIEVVVVAALLFLFLFIILACLPYIKPAAWLPVSFDQIFAPYGVILFALAGVGIVPEIHDILGTQSRARLGQVIMIGMGIIISLYILFSLAVVGVTGLATTEIAFDGLIPVLGNTFRLVATGLGSLTVLSIYFMLGIELLNTLRFDFRLPHKTAWLIVVAAPLLFYVFGAREFIAVIGFVGAVFTGALSILIVCTYRRMKQSPVCQKVACLNFPNTLCWLLIILFLGGIVFGLMNRNL